MNISIKSAGHSKQVSAGKFMLPRVVCGIARALDRFVASLHAALILARRAEYYYALSDQELARIELTREEVISELLRAINQRNDTFCHLGLRIRPIRPSDKQELANGFMRLSAKSRYLRFFSQKSTLTAEELRIFTELDGNDHFALGAFELSEAGNEGDTVGVARFIRIAENPTTAEFAVTVVDDWQGHGIGRALLQLLLVEACRRGIKRMRSCVLAENKPMRKLAASVFGGAALRREGSVLIGDFPIPDCGPATAP